MMDSNQEGYRTLGWIINKSEQGLFLVIAEEEIQREIVEMYYRMKRQNGYSEESIMAKRRSLENVLSPLKAGWNEDMLREVGFYNVDMFWRCLNFCGWIAIK